MREATMLFHVSVDADDPRRVAEVLAEIWGGRAAPFPPVGTGSWVALAGDERNTTVEVYRRGTGLEPVKGDADGVAVECPPQRQSATHLAMSTRRNVAHILAIAEREGWPAKYRKRGGLFGVIELWVEGCRMVEVLTPEMQAEYVANLPPWTQKALAG
jgi:hypothetical protein